MGNPLNPAYVVFNIPPSRCEKLEFSYFWKTATVLNKSNKVFEPMCGQLFLSRKQFHLELLESLYFYKNLEMIPAYPFHFGQNYLLKKKPFIINSSHPQIPEGFTISTYTIR